MIKVLLADDARLVRLLLREMLARDPQIVVVGEAANGREAVELTRKLAPDLVIMDVVMPVMDGLAAVREIMATCPTPILVLSATCSPGDGKTAFQAIRMGALDVMAKPEGGLQASEDFIGPLLEKVRLLAGVRVMHHFGGRRRREPSAVPRLPGGPRSLVAIGASTGGPRALLTLLQKLPVECGARILVVQHIAKGFAPGFARWLDQESPFRVRLAHNGDQPEPGLVLVAPADQHMELRGGRVLLSGAPPVNSCRPSVDVLFRSLAEEGAAGVVGVLLTGMGQDGAAGMLALKEAGAYNIVQDEATSAVFGMPGAAIARGAAHRTLSLERIPAAVAALVGTREPFN
ncbi:chemotaxis response regulator protein-glutamate methylesterase [Desulfuromonas versatilis]|uniref:Protein-glutamate methylesterase/protein-glutamine glutaminase n=1 Tax=Desulfuromonas versatilis TaxID=2802975 RepID=A0ABN6E3X8_9BACT|nr:chemotaxis-specific protein-glutamate methyltransferase CheB [Desulfuromonas versatilis]BCR06962.1 chemotaxis response regulator protein-glutamate methylesterase [Desulfuromonas versatilis]